MLTGALTLSDTDLTLPGNSLQIAFSRTYINQLGNNPGGFRGDVANNGMSMNLMRIVEGDSGDPPGSIIVCYEMSFECRLAKVSGTARPCTTSATTPTSPTKSPRPTTAAAA